MKTNNILSENPKDVHLEWVNDYLTVEKMAEHYGVDQNELLPIVIEGCKQNNPS